MKNFINTDLKNFNQYKESVNTRKNKNVFPNKLKYLYYLNSLRFTSEWDYNTSKSEPWTSSVHVDWA